MLWNVLFLLCIAEVVKYGSYITNECPQVGYICPKICDVDHKHHPRKECEDAKGKGNVWEKTRKASGEKEKQQEKIEEHKDGKAEQESKSDTTAVQSIK